MGSIVLLGGSSVAFGYNSPMLSEDLGMPVINAGLNAGVGLKLMVEESFPYLKKGDVLVFSPEYDHFFGDFAYGFKPLAEVFFQGRGACASKMNWRQWRVVFFHMPMMLQQRLEYAIKRSFFSPESTTYQLSSFNEYGDIVAHWKEQHELLQINLEKESIKEPNRVVFLWLEKQLREISERGVQVYMVPPILAQTAYANKEDNIQRVESKFQEIGFPFVCPPAKMAYPDPLFYDTFYHLDSLGAAIHTEDISSLLKKNHIVAE